MAGRVEVDMFNQSQGSFMNIFMDEGQQFEADQEDKQSFGAFKECHDVQSPDV